jgi:hypothetical protein
MDYYGTKIITNKIINLFCNRIGFDYWWQNLDIEIKNEIKEEISIIIESIDESPIMIESINLNDKKK